MRRAVPALFSLFLVINPLASLAEPPEALPEVLYTEIDGRKHAIWVAAERVLTPSGEIDENLFPYPESESLKTLMELPEKNGCIRLSGVTHAFVNIPVRENVLQAARSAKLVLIAKVTGLRGGFRGTEGGSLIQVVTEEVLKTDDRRLEDLYYLFIPNGTFSVGSHRFCARNLSFPELPEVGDQLLLFVPVRHAPSNPLLEFLDEGGLVVLKRDSTVGLSPSYQKDPSVKKASSRDLVEKVRRAISPEGKE